MTRATQPTDDEPTMVLAAALPLALSESPERVAVIGFGSGLTPHTLLADQRIKSVNTIEIEQAMVDGKPWNKTAPAPRLPQEVIAKTSAKYREALARLTA